MNNLKELYNALSVIQVKSKSLGLCTGLESSCRECKHPNCKLPMWYVSGKDVPNGWRDYLSKFPMDFRKHLEYLVNYCHMSRCHSCIFACKEGECGLSLMPLKNFSFLANHVKEKMKNES